MLDHPLPQSSRDRQDEVGPRDALLDDPPPRSSEAGIEGEALVDEKEQPTLRSDRADRSAGGHVGERRGRQDCVILAAERNRLGILECESMQDAAPVRVPDQPRLFESIDGDLFGELGEEILVARACHEDVNGIPLREPSRVPRRQVRRPAASQFPRDDQESVRPFLLGTKGVGLNSARRTRPRGRRLELHRDGILSNHSLRRKTRSILNYRSDRTPSGTNCRTISPELRTALPTRSVKICLVGAWAAVNRIDPVSWPWLRRETSIG